VNEETRAADGQPHDSLKGSTDPENSFLCKQRDGIDYERRFEHHLAEVEAVRAPPLDLHFGLGLPGLGLNVLLLLAIAFDFFRVLVLNPFELFGVLRGEDRYLVQEKFVAVPADALGLILSPLVGRLRLEQEFLRVRTVSEQGNGGHQDRENRHRYGHRREAWMMRPFFGVLV
jgi:hypothetical protein